MACSWTFSMLVALLTGVHAVLNGDPAPAEVGSWFVHYRYLCYSSYINSTYWLECGGSLISPTTVLTAAHCLYNPQWVENGPTSIQRIDLTVNHGARAQNFTIFNPRDGADVLGHPNYWETSWAEPYYQKTTNHDIAIIRLPRAVSGVTPVSVDLGQRVEIAGGGSLWVSMEWGNSSTDQATVLGYGQTDATGAFSDVLRTGRVQLLSSRTRSCNFESDWNGEVSPGMLCTLPGSQKAQLSAHGDSGGPIVILGRNGQRDVQIGIVSFGRGANPAISTRVSAYSDFLLEHAPGVHSVQLVDGYKFGAVPEESCTRVGVALLVLAMVLCLALGGGAGVFFARRSSFEKPVVASQQTSEFVGVASVEMDEDQEESHRHEML